MISRSEWKPLVLIVGVFLAFFWLPLGNLRFDRSVTEALTLAKSYAREHVVLCLVPAFLIAGAISVFVSQAAVMKYLGARANKLLAYAVASVSGSVLAVCSCTILPLFAGIYKRGAGLGPATAFLYSGPAINILAIVLTARILGLDMGVARAAGAVGFSVIIGLLMALIFRREEGERAGAALSMPESEVSRPLWKNVIYLATMVGVLVFANWGGGHGTVPAAGAGAGIARSATSFGIWQAIGALKWWLAGASGVAFAAVLVAWFHVKWWHTVLAAFPALVAAFVFPQHPPLAFTTATIGLVV
ncbi:MAG: permease, partial [Candidatus Eisenbacteria bacterium]